MVPSTHTARTEPLMTSNGDSTWWWSHGLAGSQHLQRCTDTHKIGLACIHYCQQSSSLSVLPEYKVTIMQLGHLCLLSINQSLNEACAAQVGVKSTRLFTGDQRQLYT